MPNLAWVLVAALSLGGCAIRGRPYVPPTAGDVAHFQVQLPPGTKAAIATFDEGETCKGRHWLQAPGRVAAVTTSSVRIPAGKQFSAAIHHGMGGSFGTGFRFCIPVVNFVPEPGRFYRATFMVSADACTVRLDSSTSDMMVGSRVEALRKMEFSNGWSESGSFCGPAM